MYYLYTDGGSRRNPGNSAIGYFLFESSTLVDFGGKFVGIGTNNNAEYCALIEGLRLAIKNNIRELTCVLDSELVVKQQTGKYKISNEEIKKSSKKIQELTKQFKTLEYKYVPRAQNKFADKLVNIILDTIESK